MVKAASGLLVATSKSEPLASISGLPTYLWATRGSPTTAAGGQAVRTCLGASSRGPKSLCRWGSLGGRLRDEPLQIRQVLCHVVA